MAEISTHTSAKNNFPTTFKTSESIEVELMCHFYTLCFKGGIEVEHWLKIG